MDDITVLQMADFLSIALEAMESENYEVAEDFVEDVYASLQDEIDSE